MSTREQRSFPFRSADSDAGRINWVTQEFYALRFKRPNDLGEDGGPSIGDDVGRLKPLQRTVPNACQAGQFGGGNPDQGSRSADLSTRNHGQLRPY